MDAVVPERYKKRLANSMHSFSKKHNSFLVVRLRRMLLVMIIAPIIVLVLHYSKHFLDVDTCLDAGKIYDYIAADCRSDLNQLPYVPYSERYSWLLVSVAATIGLGLLGMLFTLSKKR